MNILKKYGKEDLAILYIAEINGRIVEFVESIQPPVPREEKWVLIISTLYGCPIHCAMCDAGEYYQGKVSKDEMLGQIMHMVAPRYPNMDPPMKKLKIQFARMGEPSLNPDVLALLRELPEKLPAPGLLPCVSTVAPKAGGQFLNDLIAVKNGLYSGGMFQLQFSIHSTDENLRKAWIPAPLWSFEEIKAFGIRWFRPGDRKITLNFAVAQSSVIDPAVISAYFSPDKYLIKLTPMNPTFKAQQNGLDSQITAENRHDVALKAQFEAFGYEAIVSIGEWEENQIGSNCGQFATQFMQGKVVLKDTYTCEEYTLPVYD